MRLPHNLTSRDWTSDEVDHSISLGEYDGPRTWHPGTGPEIYPESRAIGERSCFADGETEAPPNPDPFQDGFPVQCFRAFSANGDLETLATDVTSREVWKLHARIVCLLYTDPTRAYNAALAMFPDAVASVLDPTDIGVLPRRIIIKTPFMCIVWMSGTATQQQLAAQILYAGNGPTDQGPFATNPTWWDVSSQVAADINSLGAGFSPIFTLIGHSYGGAILSVLGARMKAAAPNRPVKIITYGCPRTGDQRMQDLLNFCARANLVSEGDPVPALPPSQRMIDGIAWLLGVPLALVWRGFTSNERQIGVLNSGALDYGNAELVSDSVISTSADLIGQGNALPFFPDHAMSGYVAKLWLPAVGMPPCMADLAPPIP